jgi:hypothetical protein
MALFLAETCFTRQDNYRCPYTEAWSYGFNPSIKLSPFNPSDLLDFPGLTDNARVYAFFNNSPKVLTPQQLQRFKEITLQLGKDARDLLLGILYEYVSSNTDLIRQVMPIYQLDAKDANRLDYKLRRQSPYFQAGRVIGSAAAIAQGLFEFVIGTGGDIAGGSACATVVGCTIGAPTIAGSIALQVHGATTAVAGAKNLGKVLSEIVSVVFASSSASGAGNNPGSSGTPSSSGTGSSSTSLIHTQPDLGRKLDYIFGKATGNEHNIARSSEMLRQLERVGLPDTFANRRLITEHLATVLNDVSNIVQAQGGRVVRESLLMGPRGAVKLETVWEGAKLITIKVFGMR